MIHIFYIHGFASSGISPKSMALQAAFPNATVHMQTYAFDPIGTMDDLSDRIRSVGNSVDTRQIILVGTSLGGFYARLLSTKFDIPAILINPLIDPQSSSSISIGEYTNYASGEKFEVLEQDIDELIHMNQITVDVDMTNIHYFANEDDDVISCSDGLLYFHHAKTKHVYSTGGHRFNQISRTFPTIRDIINQPYKGIFA